MIGSRLGRGEDVRWPGIQWGRAVGRQARRPLHWCARREAAWRRVAHAALAARQALRRRFRTRRAPPHDADHRLQRFTARLLPRARRRIRLPLCRASPRPSGLSLQSLQSAMPPASRFAMECKVMSAQVAPCLPYLAVHVRPFQSSLVQFVSVQVRSGQVGFRFRFERSLRIESRVRRRRGRGRPQETHAHSLPQRRLVRRGWR